MKCTETSFPDCTSGAQCATARRASSCDGSPPSTQWIVYECAADTVDRCADAATTCPAVCYCMAGIQLYWDSPINLVETTMQYNIITGVGFGGGSVCFFVGAALLLARQVCHPILWAALSVPTCPPTGSSGGSLCSFVDAALLLARQVRLEQFQEIRWFFLPRVPQAIWRLRLLLCACCPAPH